MKQLTRILLLTLAVLSLCSLIAFAQFKTSGKRKIVAQVSPEYPGLAKKMHLTGAVRLMVTVGAPGKATHTEVLGGNPLLAQAAVDAVNKSKWEPGAGETKEIIEVKFQPETD